MILINSLLIGILSALAVYVLTYEKPTLLAERFKKTSTKKESVSAHLMSNFLDYLKPFSQKNIKSGNTIAVTKKLLLQAGRASSEEDVVRYETRRIANVVFALLICCFFVLLLGAMLESFIACFLIIAVAYKLPEIQLKKEIKARQKEFVKYLPDAVDLLSICVQAGLGLDAAFSKIAEEFYLTSPVVAGEFDRLNKDILSGLNRQDAYKNLVSRIDNSDLQSFVALLVQTDKLGTSITQSLEAFCDSMRTRKRQRIEELAQQASTKMTVPMVLCMLPAIFIIIMYPAFQKITVGLGKM